MLQSMREKMQGIVAGTIVVIIALTFALWGIQNYTKTGSATDAVAKVNGVTITQQQLHLAYERAKRMKMATSGAAYSFDQKEQALLKAQVLQQLIKNTAIIETMKKMGFGVGAQQLNIALSELPIFQVNGAFSLEKFQQLLSNMGYSENDFISELEHSIMLTQLSKGLLESNFALPDEINNYEKLLNQKRDFGYFLINAQATSKDIQIPTTEIQDYYKKHSAEFMSPEKISIQYVQLSSDDLKNSIHVTAEVLKKYYHEHIGSFSSPKEQSYDQVANKVKQLYVRQQLLQSFSEKNDKLADLVYTNSDSLLPAVKELGLQINTTGLFTSAGESTGILANPKIVKAAFGDTVLKQGYNSSPIEISPGNVVVLRIKEHLPEAVLPLEKVRQSIQQKLEALAMQRRAVALSKEILADLQRGQSPEELGKRYDLAWHTLENADSRVKGVDAAITSAAFALPIPKLPAISASTVELGEHGVAVIKLNKVVAGVAKEMSPEMLKQAGAEFENGQGQFENSLLSESILKNSRIKIEDDSSTDTQQQGQQG